MADQFLSIENESELKALQRTFVELVRRPLTAGEKMVPDERVSDFISGNALLEPQERLELYAQQYWWRLIGNMQDDFSVTRKIMGSERFRKAMEAYFTRYPSVSFTLRHAGERLPEFIVEEPVYFSPFEKVCFETARLELAVIQSFNAAEREPITFSDLQVPPSELRFCLKPSLVLLAGEYQAHKLVEEERLTRRKGRGDASNVLSALTQEVEENLLKEGNFDHLRQPTFLVVHRYELAVFFKEQTRLQFVVLGCLGEGRSLEDALQLLDDGRGDGEEVDINRTFQEWVQLGWLCAA